MNRINVLTLLTFALSATFTTSAFALKKCEELTDEAKKKQCLDEVEKKCGNVEGYWPKRNCVEPIIETYDICKKPEYPTEQMKARDLHTDICVVSPEPNLNDTSLPGARLDKKWLERYKASKTIGDVLKKHHEKWGTCDRDSESMIRKCDGKTEVFVEAFYEAATWHLNTKMNQVQTMVQIKDIRNYVHYVADFKSKVEHIAEYFAIHPELETEKYKNYLKEKLVELEKAEKTLEQAKIDYYNSRSCPSPRLKRLGGDKKLAAKLKKMMKKVVGPNGTIKHAFVVSNGQTNRNLNDGKDYKNYEGMICVKAKGKKLKELKAKKYPTCYSQTAAFRQEKMINDHKWSSKMTLFADGHAASTSSSSMIPFNCKKLNK